MFIKVIVGSSEASIRRLYAAKVLQHIDLMFLDHYKPAYTTDLKLCEELRLVTPGTVLAADNVITPGNPPYLEYVRSSVAEKRSASEDSKPVTGVDTRFKERTTNQYLKREGAAKLDSSVKGNPNLVFESKLINNFEPSGEAVSLPKDMCLSNHPSANNSKDGVEITRCIGEER
jgi:catechol O-methyltransferase